MKNGWILLLIGIGVVVFLAMRKEEPEIPSPEAAFTVTIEG